jgi:hypothetical protein
VTPIIHRERAGVAGTGHLRTSLVDPLVVNPAKTTTSSNFSG